MPSRFPSGWLVAAVLVASIALWAVMVLGPLAHLRALAGGLAPFDLRPFGYGPAEAEALLVALGEDGRSFYARVQLRLDAVYPASYALSRGLLLLWLTAPGRISGPAIGAVGRWALLALPLITAGFDYAENASLAAMLAAGPAAASGLVAAASAATQVKSLAGALTEAAVVILAGIALLAWWRGRRGARTGGPGAPGEGEGR
ncbi:MAG: hypothetical protein HY521_08670 [Proteobacteria bacterium]|nr:hypothetical protein [Pseudomonadota bacterium]